MVSKRCFFHASGFDPHDAAAQYRRFVREATRFARTWNVTVEVGALRQTQAYGSCWSVTTRAAGWQVTTEYVLLDWSDIVRGELRRPVACKLSRGLAAFGDLVRTGTAWRYFTANWRYGMFFLVPFLNVFLFAAIAVLAGCYAGAVTASALMSATGGVAAAALVAALAFATLMQWPGERWRVGQALADWTFAGDYMRGRHTQISARIDDFAARLVACARRNDVDEIVIAGHSLGAAVAVDALAQAFDRDPALGSTGPKLALLTIGAVIPKIALHPRGTRLRSQVQRLAAEPLLTWAEYQARDDFISFYKFDPVKLAPFDDLRPPGGLIIGRVQIHQMLSQATLRRLRFSYMRLHYQFVMANEQRTVYDYFMLVCGPAPFRCTVTAAGGAAGLYGIDGAYPGVSCTDTPGAGIPAPPPLLPLQQTGDPR